MNIRITVTSEELGDLEVSVDAGYRTMQDDPRVILEGIIGASIGKVRRAYELGGN